MDDDATGPPSEADTWARIPVDAVPGDPAEIHAANLPAWNQAAGRYAERHQQTVAELRAGVSNLHPLERELLAPLGPLTVWCREAIHLQCASGRDTLSLLLEGAHRVTGVDFSDVHIANAHRLSAALGLAADWYCADVLAVPSELDGRFDLVYTGRGALCWLFDIAAWARVVARLLRPGGVLSVLDSHPVSWLLDEESSDLRIAPGASYFGQAGESTGWCATYLPGLTGSTKRERAWTLAEVVGALLDAGLRIERLGEHGAGYYDAFPNLPDAERARVPMTFTLLARRPPQGR